MIQGISRARGLACRLAERALQSLNEAFEVVLQYLEATAPDPQLREEALPLAALRTLARCVNYFT